MNNDYKRFQEGVIRSILARPSEIRNIVNFVKEDDFEDVNFQLVYNAMIDLFTDGKNISLAEIALKISEKGGAINSGWLFNLENNMIQWVEAAPPSTWAKLLKKESAKQKAINVLKEGIESINNISTNPLVEMDKISTALTKVSVSSASSEKFDIRNAIDNFKKDTVAIQQTEGSVAAISSAYPSIDTFTQGWAPTHLITIGARTGIGKSVFAINNAIAALQQGKSVLFFSLEMTEREVISRMVSSLSMVPIHKIEKAEQLTPEEDELVNDALEFIANSKLTIDTEPHVTIDYLKRTSIREAQSEQGLDFIIIDYLQLIENNGKKNRQEAVSEVSRSVKILAKTLNVPVMVLVQVNRERREEEGDQIPKLHDIRESGAIAQDSNVVILIHRNLEEDAESIDPKAIFFIAKNRQGESNKYLTVRTRLECSLFLDDSERAKKRLQEQELAAQNMPNEMPQMSSNFNQNDEVVGLFDDTEGFGEDVKGISYPINDFGNSINNFENSSLDGFGNSHEPISGEDEIQNYINSKKEEINFESETSFDSSQFMENQSNLDIIDNEPFDFGISDEYTEDPDNMDY